MVATMLQGLLGLAFLGSGAGKLAGGSNLGERAREYRYSGGFLAFVAVAELVGALGLAAGFWLHSVAPLAAVGLAILMAGAVYTHILRAHDPAPKALPAVVLLVLLMVTAVLRWPALG